MNKKKMQRKSRCPNCGRQMKADQVRCARCGWLRAVAVESARPVKMPERKRPRCPNPQCKARGKRKAIMCARCGTPFTAVRAARAEKAAISYQAGIQGTPEYFERLAYRSYDPATREAWRAAAMAARKAANQDARHSVELFVKSSGARSLRAPIGGW